MSKECPKCKRSSDGKFCPYCGENLTQVSETLQQPDSAPVSDETVIYSADSGTGSQRVPDPEQAGNPWFSQNADSSVNPDADHQPSSSQMSSADKTGDSVQPSDPMQNQPDIPGSSQQYSYQGYSGQPDSQWRNEQMNWQEKGGSGFFSGTMGSYQPAGLQIPLAYRPISMWGYFGYSILFSIPCVGLIFLCIFAFGRTANLNLKNYARSYFCVYIIGIILAVILWVTIFAAAFAHGSVYYRYYY